MPPPKIISARITAYGLFLLVSGLAGFFLTNSTSTSALLNGAVGGALMMLLGLLHRQGRPFTLPAAAGAAAIFTITFVWRGTLQWIAIADGREGHLGVALLLTVMMAVSGIVLTFLVRQLRK